MVYVNRIASEHVKHRYRVYPHFKSHVYYIFYYVICLVYCTFPGKDVLSGKVQRNTRKVGAP